MPVVFTPVDVEALLSTYLRSCPAVTDLVEQRVYTALPHQRIYPLLLLERTGGGYTSGRPLYLDAADVTFAAYGGTRKVAQQVMSACLESLTPGLIRRHEAGAVTGIRPGALAYEPDPDSADSEGHARPRFTCVVTVLTHP